MLRIRAYHNHNKILDIQKETQPMGSVYLLVKDKNNIDYVNNHAVRKNV